MKKYIFLIISIGLFPSLVFAEIQYNITTPIPGFSGNTAGDIGSYIIAAFNFGLAIVGLVAFGSIVLHGVKYIMGAGNESLVSDAREGIKQAVFGVILLLGSVILLDTINPCILQTVNFWRDRDTVHRTCVSGAFNSIAEPQTQIPIIIEEDQGAQNAIASGNIKVSRDSNGHLEIIGIDENAGNSKKIIVYSSGAFETYGLINGSFVSLNISGDNINTFDINIFKNLDIKPEGLDETNREIIELEIRKYLLEKTSLKYDSTGISLDLPTDPEEKEKLKNSLTPEFTAEADYFYNNHIITSSWVNCSKIIPTEPLPPYYRCDNTYVNVSTNSTPIKSTNPTSNSIIYVEYPENNNRSEKILENAIQKQANEAIEQLR